MSSVTTAATATTTTQTRPRVNRQAVAKQFVRLYYGILNTHPEFLYQFYGKNSTVTVSETMEEGETLMETAEDETAVKELLKALYSDVSVRIETAVPQFSVDESILLHVNGSMYRQRSDTHRAFTQAFVLFPQENGYYIRTDIAHVLGFYYQNPMLQNQWAAESVNADPWANVMEARNGAQETSASISSSEQSVPLRLGTYQGSLAADEGTTTATNRNSKEIRTETPPLEDAPRHSAKSQGSDHDSDEFPKRSASSQPWIIRPQSAVSNTVCHPMVAPPPMATMHSLQSVMPVAPVHMAHGPVGAMPYAMTMAAAPPANYLRHRSMSMGCDPWKMQAANGGKGVFIARLPFGVQPAEVEEAFSQFGPIEGGRDGIQVRDGRNGCYAFVTFEKAESAQTAIQQGAVLQGKRVFVEPRYPRQEAETHLVAFPPMMGGPIPGYHMPAPPPPPHHHHHFPRMPR